MYAEFCFNTNRGAYSRGFERDEKNVTICEDYDDESSLVEDILSYLDIDVDDWVDDEDGYGLSLTLADLIDYEDGVDVGAGDSVLFWVNVDGKLYETSWDENDWEDSEWDDDDDDDIPCDC